MTCGWVVNESGAEIDSVRRGQGNIIYGLKLREFHFGPVILPRAGKAEVAGTLFLQGGKVNINDVAVLKTRDRPKPRVLRAAVLEKRFDAGMLADEGLNVLQIVLVMEHPGVAHLKKAGNCTVAIAIDVAVAKEP